MKTLVKKLAMMLIMLFAIQIAFAQSTIKHVIDRGETLESIAQKYGTTKDKIIELNPKCKKFIYVGMELIIPVAQAAPKEQPSTVVTTSPAPVTNTEPAESTYEEPADHEVVSYRNTTHMSFDLAYGFLEGKGYWNARMGFGINYFLTENVYFTGKLGYSASMLTTSESFTQSDGYHNFQSTDATYHYVSLPIEIAYKLRVNQDNFAFSPLMGFDFNLGVKAKVKQRDRDNVTSYEPKIGGKCGVGLRLGLRLMMNSLNLTGSYVLPLNDNQKAFFQEDGYFELALGITY